MKRIVYFSRNRMTGSMGEQLAGVRQILESARRNNQAAGVSGALIFNSGGFAQVLEGEADSVADIFERIQRDERHADVLVLEYRDVEERIFADWSMAFLGENASSERMFGALSAESGFDASRLDANDVLRSMRRLVREEELAT